MPPGHDCEPRGGSHPDRLRSLILGPFGSEELGARPRAPFFYAAFSAARARFRSVNQIAISEIS